MSRFMRCVVLLRFMLGFMVVVAGPWATLSRGQESKATVSVDPRQELIDKAVVFLRSAQSQDGSFSSQAGPGITGLIAAGLLAVGLPPDDPMVRKGIDYILASKRPDGGLYAEGSRHANYETSLAIMALSRANSDGRYDEWIAGGQRFIKTAQWDEGEGLSEKDPAFGGAGYGSKSRPDLSNTSFFIEALRSTGAPEDDPAIQRALAFVNRCQNLESPANDTPFAAKINDGGFYYTPANGGDSMAGKDDATGGLRSYASMTYAGLKSMIYAGVDKDDYRVQAAKSFLAKNYSVTSNPGMGGAGLYYYLHTMAKTLNMLGSQVFVSEKGEHPWRQDIVAQLKATQRENGSWVNPEARWMEGDPNLVTGYVLLTLSYLAPNHP
ncbi:MAG: prenyltransferase/squalene oxidase repeat-containing protein [Planctomycetota bacterium]